MATIATILGAAYGAYSTYDNSQKQKKAAATATQGLNLGGKPDAAKYEPVDFSNEQIAAIMGNLGSLDAGSDLMGRTNQLIDQDAMHRAKRFIPQYKDSMRIEGAAANSLLKGQLPYDDVLDIVADRGESTNALGVPGTASSATLRDLGLSRLDAIKSGSGLLNNMVQIAESVNPVSRRSRPQDNFVNPSDRIRFSMEQNQLLQQTEQSANNLAAGISPTQSAAAQVQLSSRLNQPTQDAATNQQYAQLVAQLLGTGATAYDSGKFGLGGTGTSDGLSTDSFTAKNRKYSIPA